jgi:tRNA(Arg) A34 adenosine deaminase TadA
MRFVVGLARENVSRGTGGPFGAAVFEMETGRLVAPGVNMVVTAGCSVWHAEIVALAMAQEALGAYDLGGDGMPPCELVTSTEPCAMCLGAIPWSGVRRVVCGAREEDATAIGMDEGAKPADWVDAFERRGIEVVRDVCREEAAAVLRDYAACGGVIYNGRNDRRRR